MQRRLVNLIEESIYLEGSRGLYRDTTRTRYRVCGRDELATAMGLHDRDRASHWFDTPPQL
jgi:hypothetical protein